MSALSIPSFASSIALDVQADDAQLIPVNAEVSWLLIGAYTIDAFPSQVPLTVQIRLGAGPWLTVPLPMSLTGMRLKLPDAPPHSGGVFVRAAATPGIQVIGVGGP